jgi:GntR family transcriptional regulator of vanillate catabolism
MDSIDSEIATRIRNDIIRGNYQEGERLSETRLCETHQVSRTPVRLALRLLESEGVIQRGEGRGYTVQSPTVEDILQAVQVRGHLESLAARLMAQSPERSDHLPAMQQAIETLDNEIDTGYIDEPMIHRMRTANKLFHTTILDACGNDYVGFTCKQISHLPMLAAGSMVFDRSVQETPERMERGLFRLRIGNAQHKVIYEAIKQGDAVRAEGMMREHANTMIEYIETFEKRDRRLTVYDLVAYSADESADDSSV